ncbi:type IV secretory system conjugative DNA transfer family protein [Xenorhabdus nematophila]|uniref:type IV secretory system conjugative DNA transfer family protein n=1 Tax=Xenorhabdus nematophila TaxID=628 RepID=UPI0032B7D41E
MNRLALPLFFLMFVLPNRVLAIDSQLDKNQTLQLEQILSPSGYGINKDEAIRIDILRDLGETLGFRAGMANRSASLITSFSKWEKELDRIYNFSPLITSDSTLPPVVVEAQNLASISRNQFRFSNKVYNILKDAEFVSTPPTWRSYLYTGLRMDADADFPSEDALPRNNVEKKAWKESVEKGWSAGFLQADQIVKSNFNRLTRDFTGMLLYNTLLAQNIVTKTEVATSSNTVSPESNKRRLILGERYQRIIKSAEFKKDDSKWKPVLQEHIEGEEFSYGDR